MINKQYTIYVTEKERERERERERGGEREGGERGEGGRVQARARERHTERQRDGERQSDRKRDRLGERTWENVRSNPIITSQSMSLHFPPLAKIVGTWVILKWRHTFSMWLPADPPSRAVRTNVVCKGRVCSQRHLGAPPTPRGRYVHKTREMKDGRLTT